VLTGASPVITFDRARPARYAQRTKDGPRRHVTKVPDIGVVFRRRTVTGFINCPRVCSALSTWRRPHASIFLPSCWIASS
jgi:hypothetical protein